MGLFDKLGGQLGGVIGQVAAAAAPSLIAAALAKSNMGNLQGLVEELQQSRLKDQVQSWLSDGANLPVSPDQLRAALGNDQVRQLAQHFGVPVDDVLKLLSEHLPTVVDQASSNGILQGS